MSKPKEKAKELFYLYYLLATGLNPMAGIGAIKSYAKKSAIICCDEIMSSAENFFYNSEYKEERYHKTEHYKFWQQVKNEINQL